MLERKASDLQIEPLQARIPISKHHMSAIIDSGKPYVCSDVVTQRRFLRDDDFLKYGIHSYVALPLMKHGELIGVVDFLSLKTRSFTDTEVQLLQDVSDMVSIAVSNALAYEQINVLKEQLQNENRLLRDDQRSIYEEIVGSSTSLQKVLTLSIRSHGRIPQSLSRVRRELERNLSLMPSIAVRPVESGTGQGQLCSTAGRVDCERAVWS